MEFNNHQILSASGKLQLVPNILDLSFDSPMFDPFVQTLENDKCAHEAADSPILDGMDGDELEPLGEDTINLDHNTDTDLPNATDLATKEIERQIYICRECIQYVDEQYLDRHHFMAHRDIPRECNIFELETDDNMEYYCNIWQPTTATAPEILETSLETSQKYTCLECFESVCDELLNSHHMERHSQIPFECNIFELEPDVH